MAVLIGAGLFSVIGWWIGHGGARGRTVEIQQAEPQTARFQIDINKADWPEFATLPGVGRKLAERIVQSRQQSGPYSDLDDLRRVRGIGAGPLETLRPIYGRCRTAKPWRESRVGPGTGHLRSGSASAGPPSAAETRNPNIIEIRNKSKLKKVNDQNSLIQIVSEHFSFESWIYFGFQTSVSPWWAGTRYAILSHPTPCIPLLGGGEGAEG